VLVFGIDVNQFEHINDVQQLRNHCRASNLDQYDVVQANAVERVQKCQGTLDFMGLDHAFEDIPYSQALSLTSEVIRDGKNGTKVIGWMTPYGTCSQTASFISKRVIWDVHSAAKKQSL
jgi:hypothetical protein